MTLFCQLCRLSVTPDKHKRGVFKWSLVSWTEAAACHVYCGFTWERVIRCVPTSSLITNRCNFGVYDGLAAVHGVLRPPVRRPPPGVSVYVRACRQWWRTVRTVSSFLWALTARDRNWTIAGLKSSWPAELELKTLRVFVFFYCDPTWGRRRRITGFIFRVISTWRCFYYGVIM